MNKKPLRIVSLVPSITETLFHLGLKERIVGRTKFCIHPIDEVQDVDKIGGTKTVHVDKVKKLNPDLVIANKEENLKEDVDAISSFCPTYVSEVKDWDSCISMILDLGQLCDVSIAADKLVQEINQVRSQFNFSNRGRVLYLIWNNPFMTIGKDTFIHQMLVLAGYTNIINQFRYPTIEIEDYIDQVDFIFLSSEPFPFKEKHSDEIYKRYGKKCILVDGELFSWYGNRMLKALQYFNTLPSIS